MFRRKWSGLPKDVSFPRDLKQLGYFVHENDEVRNIENPDLYFKYFLDKNDRINMRQRFAFDQALEDIIHERLESLGLEKLTLPLEATGPSIPIFASKDIKSKSRIVIILGETSKDLGILAGRVASGKGGIDKGSMMSIIRALQRQKSTPDDPSPPGVMLANMGQMYWWPEGKRALTAIASLGVSVPSLVHWGRKFVPALNEIPGNESAEQHLVHLFEEVLPGLVSCDEHPMIDIIAIGDCCDIVQRYMHSNEVWSVWHSKLSSMVLMESTFEISEAKNLDFAKFMAKRSRCYLRSHEPLNTPLAATKGNEARRIPALGVPCFSSEEEHHVECILIHALVPTLQYLQDNALNPAASNTAIVVQDPEPVQMQMDQDAEDAWAQIPDEIKPGVEIVSSEQLELERKQMRMWKKFEVTGMAMDDDSDEILQARHVATKGDYEVFETL